MDPTIIKILTNNQVDGRIFTHGSMGTVKGSYQLNNRVREEFFDRYTQAVLDNNLDIIEAGIGETTKIHSAIPVLVDLDIKMKEEDALEIMNGGDKLYTDEQVEQVVTVYQSILRKILNNCHGTDLTCVLLEKPAYADEKNTSRYLKNGFHLHFPGIFMNKKDQKNHLIPRVKDEFKSRGIFDNLFDDSSSVIDTGYLSTTWLLYGTSKGEGKQPYNVTKVFDEDCEEITPDEAFKKYQIFDCHEKLIKIHGGIEKYLPRILSVIPHNRIPKELKTNIVSPLKQKLVEERKKVHASVDAKKAAEIAKELIPMISPSRADDHNDWMTVGWALYNATEGSDEGFDLWNTFTQTGEEPRPEERCVYEWGIMKRHVYTYTLGTLHYFASQDSPEVYKEYKIKQSSKYMEEAIDGSHNDIAKMLKSEYASNFVCASIDSKTWFEFKENTWDQMEGGVFLRMKISNELADRFHELNNDIWAKVMKSHEKSDEGEKAKWDKRLKQLQQLRKNLKSAPYKNNIMRECICAGSLVTLSNGLSIKIEDMYNSNNVLGWNEKNNGMTHSNQTVLMDKGVRECVEIVLEDGRTLTLTHDHPVLLNTGKWIEAGKLSTSDIIQCGLTGVYHQHEDIDWSIDIGYKTLSYSDNVNETLAFARILGFLITDGHIHVRDNHACDSVYFRHIIDAKSFINDINLLTNKTPKITTTNPRKGFNNGVMYTVTIPNEITRGILTLDGIKHGHRVNTTTGIPTFLLSDDCPITIIKEFLGGLFGGDGHAPYLDHNKNSVHSIGFSQTKTVEYKDSLYQYIDNLKYLLNQCGINNVKIRGDKILYTEQRHEKCIEKGVYIGISDLINFHVNIGFRYCVDKATKLEAIASYRNMHDNVSKQYNDLVNQIMIKSNYQYGKRGNVKQVVKEECDRFFQNNIILNQNALKMKYSTIIRQMRTGVDTHKFSHSLVCGIHEYLKRVNAHHYFGKGMYHITQDVEYIPGITLRVAGVKRDIGEKQVYDISVNDVHTFVANGIVVHNCQDEFYDPRFKEKLDTNPYLIAFQNGVYDLEKNIFRKGRPEDFLSKEMNVNYTEYDEDDEEVQEVVIFLQKIFPDKTLFKYFMDLASDVFVGGNHQKKVYFWLGCGDNGKSVLQKLMELMLGKLAIKFDTSLITGKKPSQGAAHAELARAGGGVRWATLDEPNKDEQINSGIMKKLSGNDSYWARDLFEKGKDTREIHPLFKLIFICNKLPHIKYSDKATWNRIRVLLFESTFLDSSDPDLPSTWEEQLREKKFPKDLDLEKKLPGMAEPFAWLLLQHRMKVTSRTEPEKVMLATNMYRRQSDIYRQFIEESISEDPEKSITLSSLYATFIDWFRQCYPGQSVHPRPDVQDYFETIWGTCDVGKKWKGYRLRTVKDDVKDGNVILLGGGNEEVVEEEGTDLPFMG
jgi:P4 family phage/plasmid primase-like protien